MAQFPKNRNCEPRFLRNWASYPSDTIPQKKNCESRFLRNGVTSSTICVHTTHREKCFSILEKTNLGIGIQHHLLGGLNTVETGYKVTFCPRGKLHNMKIYFETGQNLLSRGISELWRGYFETDLTIYAVTTVVRRPRGVWVAEFAKKNCPRLRELAPWPEAGSHSLGQTLLAISVDAVKVSEVMAYDGLTLVRTCPVVVASRGWGASIYDVRKFLFFFDPPSPLSKFYIQCLSDIVTITQWQNCPK